MITTQPGWIVTKGIGGNAAGASYDFLEDDFLEADFRLADFFDEDFLPDDFFFGTLPPALRASDSPIAIACFLLVTFLPEPLLNVPFLRSRIVFSTFSDAFLPSWPR